jgi:signal transduction histidine kinase
MTPAARVGSVQGVTTTAGLPRLIARARSVNPQWIDLAIGAAFTVLSIVGLYGDDGVGTTYNEPGAWAVFLALACSVPYFFRRRAPGPVLIVTATALTALALGGYSANVQSMMLLVGAFTVGSHAEGRPRLVATLWLAGTLLVIVMVGLPDASRTDLTLSASFYAGAYLFGSTVRNRRLYLEQLEARAAELERERDEEARRAVAEERLRIAQELHDVVAHSMGVIAVQAGVGSHVIETDPSEAKHALDAIATTSRATLTEIRRLLGVLRGDTAAQYQPAPGLDDLDILASDLDAVGLPVAVRVEGSPDEVPAGVDLTGYRIVQEALTNVLKHAGPAHAQVVVRYEEGAVTLEICDDGRGPNGSKVTGHGLVGMRERVGVYGGELTTGPRPGGGFRVSARLPYGTDA